MEIDKKIIAKKSGRISPDKFLKVVTDYYFLFKDKNFNYFKHISKEKYIKVKNNVHGE